MNPILNKYKAVVTILGLVFLAGCSASTDEDKIGDAQFCLDELPVTGLNVTERTARVNTCLNKLGDLNTKQASLIRCSANFLIEGFGDPTRIIGAMENVGNQQGGNGGGNGGGTVAMMNVLKFSSHSSNSANSEFVEETLTHCRAAGSPGYVMVASFSRIATSLTAVTNVNLSDGLSQTEINDVIAAGPEVIGQTAEIAYQTSCADAENANAELCSQLGAAIQPGMTSEQIGTALLQAWQSQ